jgi:DNA-binding NarL/FixJ family response regulator
MEERTMTDLSPRQREIVILIGAGWFHKEIAEHLGIVHQSVKNHTVPLFQKLDVLTGASAVARALDLGLVTFAEIEDRRLSRNDDD